MDYYEDMHRVLSALLVVGLFFVDEIPTLSCTVSLSSLFHEALNVYLFHFKSRQCELVL